MEIGGEMYRINGDQVFRIILSAQPYLREDTKIAFGGHYVHGDIKDLYMAPDNIYVLFSKYQTMPESVLDKCPSAFSGGELQRPAVAQALAGSRQMLIIRKFSIYQHLH